MIPFPVGLMNGRRAFSPLDLSPALWLDGLDSATILNASALPAANGEQVATWLDKSGNGNHAVQAVNSMRPLKGSDCLEFDGVDDVLGNTLKPNTPDYTLFLIYEQNTIQPTYIPAYFGNPSIKGFGFAAVANKYWLLHGGAGLLEFGEPITSGFHLLSGRRRSSDLFSELFHDGNLGVSGALSITVPPDQNFNLGTDGDVKIKTILFYPYRLNDEQLAQVHSYLQAL